MSIPTKQFRFKDGKLQQAFVMDRDDADLADSFHAGYIDKDVFERFDGSFSRWLDNVCYWVTVQSAD